MIYWTILCTHAEYKFRMDMKSSNFMENWRLKEMEMIFECEAERINTVLNDEQLTTNTENK